MSRRKDRRVFRLRSAFANATCRFSQRASRRDFERHRRTKMMTSLRRLSLLSVGNGITSARRQVELTARRTRSDFPREPNHRFGSGSRDSNFTGRKSRNRNLRNLFPRVRFLPAKSHAPHVHRVSALCAMQVAYRRYRHNDVLISLRISLDPPFQFELDHFSSQFSRFLSAQFHGKVLSLRFAGRYFV